MSTPIEIPVYESDDQFYVRWMDYLRDNKNITLALDSKENTSKTALYGKRFLESFFECAANIIIESGKPQAIIRLGEMIEISVDMRDGKEGTPGCYPVSVEGLAELKKMFKNDASVSN